MQRLQPSRLTYMVQPDSLKPFIRIYPQILLKGCGKACVKVRNSGNNTHIQHIALFLSTDNNTIIFQLVRRNKAKAAALDSVDNKKNQRDFNR